MATELVDIEELAVLDDLALFLFSMALVLPVTLVLSLNVLLVIMELIELTYITGEPVVEEQSATVDRFVTPAALQKLSVYAMVASWSAASQANAEQHATSLMKFVLLHMQDTSRLLQPPIELLLVNSATNSVWTKTGLSV